MKHTSLLLLLLLTPVVMGGGGAEFDKMWDEMKREIRGGGGEVHHRGGMEEGRGHPHHERGMESEEHHSEEEEEDMDLAAMKRMMERMYESHGWGSHEEQETGGRHRDSHEDSHDKDHDKDHDKKMKMFEEFKDWLHGQKEESREEEREEARDEYNRYLEKHDMSFQKYMEMKEMKDMEEKHEKEAMMKQMMKIKMKKMMMTKMSKLQEEYKEEKLRFMFGISSHFLDFCNCDDSKDVLMRLHDGHYGSAAPHSVLPVTSSMTSMSNFTDSMHGMDFVYDGVAYNMSDPVAMQEFAMWFSTADRHSQLQCVLHDLARVMCASGKQYLAALARFEHALVDYHNNNNNSNHSNNGTSQGSRQGRR